MTPQERIAAIRAKAAANRLAVQNLETPKVATLPAPEPETTPAAPVTTINSNIGPGLNNSTEFEPFKMKLAELSQALEEQVPGFAVLLRDIHREMQKDPNVVTIMTEEEIGLVVRGLTKHMDITIVPAKTSSGKAKAGSRTQPVTADDL